MAKRDMVRATALAFLTAMGVLANISTGTSQTLPTSPIRVIVPYAPGSTNDYVLRLISEKVTENGGPRIIFDSRPGGGGVPAAMAVKQAAPDGLTLFLCDIGTFSVNKSLMANLPYDPLTDFKPITPLWIFPSVLAVPASLEANTVPELVALAKRTPGGLSYGSQGVGSGGHIRGAILAKVSGAPLVHVPYRGGAPAVADLAAGRIAFLMGVYGSVQGQAEAGKVKVIGISSKTRLPMLPNIPTLGEVGYPEVDLDAWFGLAAPAGTPDSIIEALRVAFTQAVQSPDVESKLNARATYRLTSSTSEFVELIKSDIDRMRPIVESVGK